ncbi:MAG TPA: cytochrome c oxidase accessory protein CcoG [Kofleriaceae bacterium]|jgi:cytochrome c oxidase accessory protein FixG|nr:cytochrome c oxidase accessory protein CcoG [Kofleriaceae bacterium]
MQPLPDKVLSTLNADGTRHRLRPRLARGRFLNRRRAVGYALIALFVLLPRIRIGGRPALLIDLEARELSAFGAVFRPSDGFVLALLGIAIAVAVFLVTALWGRVWCGWGCPQTVYLELFFRPIERWLEGTHGKRATPTRTFVKWALYTALAFALANVFLAYFVGTDRLEHWVFGSPLDHPVGFGIVVGVAGLILFDFGWFREQMCIVACPYGRLQSVLLDRQSSIIGYDGNRGEPRAKPKKHLPVVEDRGDCVDCGACVAVCPTGIDIRDGLQMECIGCAQCIDACDTVMDGLDLKRGLIRYTSQAELAGDPPKRWRARTIAYPAILVLAVGALAWGIGGREGTEVWIARTSGPSFVELPDGKISAQARIKLENGDDALHRYHFSLVNAPDATLRSQAMVELGARKSIELPVFIDVPRTSFAGGKRRVHLRIDDSAGFERVVELVLIGPEGAAR